MGLVNDMPRNPGRIDNIKGYLRQEALSSHPDFRSKAQYLRSIQRMGYTGDPARENLPKIDALTFDDIASFYTQHIHGKPYAIGIIGNHPRQALRHRHHWQPQDDRPGKVGKVWQGGEAQRKEAVQHEGRAVLTNVCFL